MFINYCGDFNICPQIIWYTSLQEVEHNSLSVECRLELNELLPTEQEKIKNSNFTVEESGQNVSPSKSVWSPNPQFEGINKRWGFGEVIRFRLGHEGRTLMKNQYPYKKKTIRAARRRRSTSHKEGLHQDTTMLAPWSWTASL